MSVRSIKGTEDLDTHTSSDVYVSTKKGKVTSRNGELTVTMYVTRIRQTVMLTSKRITVLVGRVTVFSVVIDTNMTRQKSYSTVYRADVTPWESLPSRTK